MQLKKLVSIMISTSALALSMAMPAFAADYMPAAHTESQTSLSKFEGFAAGLGLGVVAAMDNSVSNVSGTENPVSYGKINYIGLIDLSYTKAVYTNWLLGAGLTYDFNKTDFLDYKSDGVSVSFEGKNHYSVYVQPMYALNDSTVAFGKLGYHSITASLEATVDGAGAASNKHHYRGFGVGGGVKFLTTSQVFVQLEAQMVNFGKWTQTYGPGATQSDTLKSLSSMITVGYQY